MSDGSFPIPDVAHLKAAAHLAATGHGDVAAARKLIKRRAKDLGVKVSSLPGFSDEGDDEDEDEETKATAAVSKVLELSQRHSRPESRPGRAAHGRHATGRDQAHRRTPVRRRHAGADCGPGRPRGVPAARPGRPGWRGGDAGGGTNGSRYLHREVYDDVETFTQGAVEAYLERARQMGIQPNLEDSGNREGLPPTAPGGSLDRSRWGQRTSDRPRPMEPGGPAGDRPAHAHAVLRPTSSEPVERVSTTSRGRASCL